MAPLASSRPLSFLYVEMCPEFVSNSTPIQYKTQDRTSPPYVHRTQQLEISQHAPQAPEPGQKPGLLLHPLFAGPATHMNGAASPHPV